MEIYIICLSVVLTKVFETKDVYNVYNSRLIGDDEKAKESLKWLARINGSDFDIDTVILNDVELTAEKTQAPEPTFLEAMKDFMKYRYVLCLVGRRIIVVKYCTVNVP